MINPEQFAGVAGYEEQFGKTIKRKLSVVQLAEKGRPYPTMTEADARAAVGEMFDEPVILPPGEWRLPAGAFGESCGPT